MPSIKVLGSRSLKTSEILPAGEYWITDPCYTLGHCEESEWIRLGELFDVHEPRYAMMEIEAGGKTFEVFMSTTNGGDGCFPVIKDGTQIGKFPVDAGMFAIIPIELLDAAQIIDNRDKDMGVLLKTTSSLVIHPESDVIGDVELGASVHIMTSDTDTDEEDETITCPWCGEDEDQCSCDMEDE